MSYWHPPVTGAKVAWGESIITFGAGIAGTINFDTGVFTIGTYFGDTQFSKVAFIASPTTIWTDNSETSSFEGWIYSWASYPHILNFAADNQQMTAGTTFYWIAVGS